MAIHRTLIRERRISLELTQKQLGAAIGVTQQAINAIENGVSVGSVSTLLAICRVLDLTIDELVIPDDAPAANGEA